MYKKTIENLKRQMIEDIKSLVSIPSVQDLSTAASGAPFGIEIRNVMDEFALIAKRMGFVVKDHEGFAISAQLGAGEDHIGVLGHLDVVEAKGWKHNPFEMRIENNFMIGRGVNDDKGPLIAGLYAAKIMKYLNPQLKVPIRVIAGGAEETTWECMAHYFQSNPQPLSAFSPDGNFPVVNGEMGILQLSLKFKEDSQRNFSSMPLLNYLCHHFSVDGVVYEGDVHLSRNPQRGKNAMFEYFRSLDMNEGHRSDLNDFFISYLLDDIECHAMGLNTVHEEMLPLRVCAMSLNTVDAHAILNLDFRYPVNVSEEKILEGMDAFSKEFNFDVVVIKSMKPLFVSKDSSLVKSLQEAYRCVMNEPAPAITKGGASYARVLTNGLAFGATFEGEDPRPHMEDETMSIDSLLKACEIYCVALELMAKNLPQ